MRVWEQSTLYYTAVLCGKLLGPDNSPQQDQGLLLGMQPTDSKYRPSIMRLPKVPAERYQCVVHEGNDTPFFNSDAVLLGRAFHSVAFATSDCGATILCAKDTGDVALVHTGRNQLMSREHPQLRVSILEAAIAELCGRGALHRHIFALSVSQIAASNFPHRGHEDEAVVRSQVELWGASVLGDSAEATLDLVQLIALQLCYYGLPKSNISRVRINPYTSPDLASKRAGKLGSNVIMLARPGLVAAHA